jgi:hypothetical protein
MTHRIAALNLGLVVCALTALTALAAPAAQAAITADAALARLADRCAEDDRALSEKARFVFVAGADRVAAVDALGKALEARVERFDLTTMVDANQYIGETEKNLERLATPVRAAASILFFDEADALFGARTATLDAVAERLSRIARGRVVVIGLKARPVVGRLGKSALSALPGAATPPWAAVCGPRG